LLFNKVHVVSQIPATPRKKQWYQVPEAWLILGLLLWAMGGSACLVTAALEYPDAVVADAAASRSNHPAH